MKKFSLLGLLLLTGCTAATAYSPPTQQNKSLINTYLVRVSLEQGVDVVPAGETCDGSGYITHGDGHKTKCPGCVKCKKTDVDNSVGCGPDCKCAAGKCACKAAECLVVPPPNDPPELGYEAAYNKAMAERKGLLVVKGVRPEEYPALKAQAEQAGQIFCTADYDNTLSIGVHVYGPPALSGSADCPSGNCQLNGQFGRMFKW